MLDERRVWWLSLAVFGLLGGLWAVSSPLMSIPDEPAHAIKAVAVWHGEIRGRDVELAPDDPAGVSTLIVNDVPEAFAELHREPECFKGKPAIPASCAPAVTTDDAMVTVNSPAGTYPPLYYVLVGWPSRFLSPYRALYVIRFCSVVLGAALLASAMASAFGMTRRGFVAVGVGLAATPTALFLIGSINPNGFEIAAAIATWVTLLDLVSRAGPLSTRLVSRAAIVSSCFLLARPISPLFWGVVACSVLAMALTRPRLRELVADRRARLAAAGVALAGVVAVGWYVWSGSGEISSKSDATLSEAAGHSFRHIPTILQQMVGVFGWLDAPTPETLSRVWIGAIVVVGVVALVVGSARRRGVLVLTGVAVFALPVAIEAVGARSLGYFWQGRYSLPLTVGIPLLASWVVASDLRVPRQLQVALAAVIGGGIAVEQFIAHGTALSRYVRGGPTSFLAYRHGGAWTPPVAALALFFVALIGFGVYGVWIALVGSSERPDPDAAAPEAASSTGIAAPTAVDPERAPQEAGW